MKNLLIVLLCFFSLNCSKQVEKETPKIQGSDVRALAIPDRSIDKSELTFQNSTSLWTVDNTPYSGYAVTSYPNNSPKQKFGILDGKKQNLATDWYPDGHLQLSANYHEGKLHGEKKTWSSDAAHILIAHHNYYLGKAHGEQKKWYTTGEPFKILNLNMGKEEGMQKAFRKNGDLYANYEARNGRIFGLKRAALCFDLEDEKVKHENQ